MTESLRKTEWTNGWPEAAGGGAAENFSDRTIRGVTNLFREIIFSNEYAVRGGLMQRIDARVKLVTVFGVIVAVSLCRRAEFIAAFYAVTIALAAASRIPLGFFIKRVWFFIPLFSGVIALPALVLVPGEPLAHLMRFGARDIVITRQGAESALIFVLRVAASVSYVVLLSLTTKWSSLLRALSAVRVPAIFVMILGISYRYIFYILVFIEEMYMGRRSRMLVGSGARGGRGWVSGRMGFTFSRALRMGDDVYEAMVSRGFTGEARQVELARPGAADLAWTVCVLLCIFGVYACGGFR